MDTRIRGLMEYLDASVSVFHAVDGVCKALEAAGYVRLEEADDWQLAPGGKYFMVRGGSAAMAFRMPAGKPVGFMMSAAHADRPTFKIKENAELTGKYTRLGVEKYGGMLMAPWLDRPLSVAGRALVQTETGVQSKLVNIDRDLLLIPNVAIHMNRKANEGYSYNPVNDTIPLLGADTAAGKWEQLLEAEAGGKVLGHDLYLYLRQKACLWGANEEYISAQALDDLECVWCCLQGFLNAGESAAVPVLCVFDSEEVGSSSAQGAASGILEDLLARICQACGVQLPQMLARSFMVSADNAHAIHPNHPEYADAANAPVMGGGIVLKFNANQRYTTDGVSAAIFRSVCGEIPVQTYYNRADLPGGSTLGNVSLAHVAVLSADIGLPQLAMHSSYETAAVQDALYLMDAMGKFYSLSLDTDGGSYTLK